MSETVFDASTVLALCYGEPGWQVADSQVDGAIISAVNLSEVVGKLVDVGLSDQAIVDMLHPYDFTIVPFDTDQAYAGGLMRRGTRSGGLSLADRACISLALSLSLPILTADRVWARLDLGVEVRLIR